MPAATARNDRIVVPVIFVAVTLCANAVVVTRRFHSEPPASNANFFCSATVP